MARAPTSASSSARDSGFRTGSWSPPQAFTAAAGGPTPADVERAITDAYRALGGGRVAVRSSATAEDLPGAAFAGLQDTFLNISGEPELLDAVRRCWASLWSDRAVAYRERRGIPHEQVTMAVVVQRMVDAEVAGVLFTANPVTGARTETVIDAGLGLGEAVVSGSVTADHIVVDQPRPPGRRPRGSGPTGPPPAGGAGLQELVATGARIAPISAGRRTSSGPMPTRRSGSSRPGR